MTERPGTHDDLSAIPTNPDLDQHFLANPAKLRRIMAAAAIRPTDDVVEVGAGVGTVAEQVPACRSLIAIEYDGALVQRLRQRVPQAHAIEGDALMLLPRLPCDVLLSNLPASLTEALVALLPTLAFRHALLTVPSLAALEPLSGAFGLEPVTLLAEDDFVPRQDVTAEVVKVVRRECN